MGKTLYQFSQAVRKATNLAIIVIFSALICSCILQVFTRYILNSSLSWTEELARFAFIWCNILGATVCLRNNSHARVSVLTDLLPQKAQHVLDYFSHVVVLTVALVMIYQGTKVVGAVSAQISPALRWPMPIIYGSIPIGGLMMAIDTILALLNKSNPALMEKEAE